MTGSVEKVRVEAGPSLLLAKPPPSRTKSRWDLKNSFASGAPDLVWFQSTNLPPLN